MTRSRLRPQWLALSLALAAFALAANVAAANVRLPHVIGDNMVLQRDAELPIWGWAAPGEEVTVTLGDARQSAAAGEDGRWSVTLPAMKAGGPHEMTIAGKNTVKLKNILVGEVWVCSGQSNMEWSVSASDNPSQEIENAKYPKIRLFHIPKIPAGTPVDDVNANWVECSPSTIGSFSAVAYFFGRKLHQELDVPVGLINTSWGGTRIEPWTPPEGFKAVPAVASIAEQLKQSRANYEKAKLAAIDQIAAWVPKAKAAAVDGQPIPSPPAWPADPTASHGAATGLYNGMIYPIVPFAIRGAIWYQGESNLSDAMLYHEKMKALIAGWRAVWDQGEFPFYYVQLAPFTYGGQGVEALAKLWEAQTATLSVPNTGMAVTTDIGNLRDIHPRNKQDVGKRLALWALNKTYDQKDVDYSGPMFDSATASNGKLKVTFEYADGLKTTDGSAPRWFSVAGENGEFVPAEAKIEGDAVLVWSDKVSTPKHVRYGWHEHVNPNLVNAAELPAVPFRTDK